ncbi:hypothetical protein [Aquabacterium sp.]|uniref:hypothetical protein n=1 Tax=Aquabacterium sp. TaxID=1872578 RepID=UPI0019B5F145|nr:hypothetical protein [Aquabacterium sp.]MBC7699033.1 hypothetical protein [Aquabacterium sp.]
MRTTAHASRGSALMFALIALTALSLAALALVRSSETATLILGNLGFRQEATAVAEQATEAAITYIRNATSADANDSSGTAPNGYYASSHDQNPEIVDVTGQQYSTPANRTMVDWEGNNCASGSGLCLLPATLTTGFAGIEQKYIILRLCPVVGAANTGGNMCSRPPTATGGDTNTKGNLGYGKGGRLSLTSGAYYRIVVRVKSSRDTTSFTETIVHQ